MKSAVHKAELERREVADATSQAKKSSLGQFFTPSAIAAFMAEALPLDDGPVRLLDPGAGLGALSLAVLARRPDATVTAYEVDDALVPRLRANLGEHGHVEQYDFIQHAVFGLKAGTIGAFTHAILNPPYKKMNSGSAHRQLLRKVGLETVNLYSGFVGLALMLLAPGGHLCAIIPRSFCNGPYYRPFRKLMLEQAAIKTMHLFDARDLAFADDDVLQENVIIVLKKGAEQGQITLTSSTDASFSDVTMRVVDAESVVRADDADQVIHFPTGNAGLPQVFNQTLADLNVSISTGPVVDFRLREHLRPMPSDDTVPLIYPVHLRSRAIVWPVGGSKKANAIARNSETEKWLYPSGDYAVVKRFSSKEEPRRIVATFIPHDFTEHERIGLENHLNVFHRGRAGLPRQLALGLVTYLNSTLVDEHFRVFNGHTQVNASDLKMLRYPKVEVLVELGAWAAENADPSQAEIDAQIDAVSQAPS